MPLFQFSRRIASRYNLIVAESVADSTNIALTFDNASVEDYNQGAGVSHELITNPDRWTVEAPYDGKIITATANVTFAADGTGVRFAFIEHFTSGGSSLYRAPQIGVTAGAGSEHHINVSGQFSVTAGDYFELSVFQTSGGFLDVEPAAGGSPATNIAFSD